MDQHDMLGLECEVREVVNAAGAYRLHIAEVVAGDVIEKSEPLTLLESGLRYK